MPKWDSCSEQFVSDLFLFFFSLVLLVYLPCQVHGPFLFCRHQHPPPFGPLPVSRHARYVYSRQQPTNCTRKYAQNTKKLFLPRPRVSKQPQLTTPQYIASTRFLLSFERSIHSLRLFAPGFNATQLPTPSSCTFPQNVRISVFVRDTELPLRPLSPKFPPQQ